MAVQLSATGQLALDAALCGAQVVTAAAREGFTVRTKSSHRDLVTEADAATELAVITYLRRHRPHDVILGEESGTTGTGTTSWTIDPIDGTANFARARADYAVAISAAVDGRLTVGAIVKPATGEWIACDESGAVAHSGGRAGVSGVAAMSDALVSVSVSVDEARRPLTLSTFTRLLPEVQDFRRTGSTSCDLLAIATGHLDAYVGIGTNPWDISPGWALVDAVGGKCLKFEVAGGYEAFVVGTPAISEKIAAVVAENARTFVAARAFPARGLRTAASPAPQTAPRPESITAQRKSGDAERSR
ncbi:inositol monophosphatase family protein [Micromonosporaceae bacterium DT194]|uniref:inositol monophosphatase family protein n=1 Tax=Melissospora conviva TaxID=3388432 RepID=UPI003C237082